MVKTYASARAVVDAPTPSKRGPRVPSMGKGRRGEHLHAGRRVAMKGVGQTYLLTPMAD